MSGKAESKKKPVSEETVSIRVKKRTYRILKKYAFEKEMNLQEAAEEAANRL